jgi:hypothetical protein
MSFIGTMNCVLEAYRILHRPDMVLASGLRVIGHRRHTCLGGFFRLRPGLCQHTLCLSSVVPFHSS